MKCIIEGCRADTRVLDSRLIAGNVIQRKRECFNLHRFVTNEMPAEKSTMAHTQRAERNAAIKADPRPQSVIATEYGLDASSVSRIKTK